jgi:malonyl-CoA/methylmalonyl-CoA synthetase
MNASLYALFLERLEGRLDDVALDAADGLWSYARLHDLAARFASLMERDGAVRGDRILVQAVRSPAVIALYLACLRAGLVFTPVNPEGAPAEVDYYVADAEPRIVFSRPDAEAALAPIASARGATLRPIGASPADGAWAEARAGAPSLAVAVLEPSDLAAIVYTSGTTGRPKGAMLTHGNLASNARALHRIWGFVPGDVLLHALPIFHVHGLFVALNTSFLNASRIVFLPRFDAAEVRRRLGEATVLMGVPTFYARLLAEPGFGKADCAHMRLFVSGSAPLTAQASDAWFDATGHRILERYGMTEAGMIASNPLEGARVAGTVGFALPDVETRVCDADGRELPRGEVGVLEVRGPNVFAGYWRAPEKTAEDMRADGFFVTGDVATMDVEGRVAIVGRAKDVIISGGFNVYPKEVELVLDELPGVRESAVVGAPHADLGEGVVAVLVAEDLPVPQSVLEAALAQALGRHKHPRRFVWVEALPRNAMGKVAKSELREMVADVYGENARA